jgi:hypothetical protein
MDYRNFQDQEEKKSRGSGSPGTNPFNRNILKGGQVDPRSKLYQRSVAGREQLKDYLSRLWNDGGDEADVFMAGVKSLMNRGHGYVGAYLDSKNPGRRYTDNQAKAIVDQVMEDEGIGDNPGARLTRPKVEDEEGNVDKEATKSARQERKDLNTMRGTFGPKQAPGKKAMPVGQQRKQGKRESTGEALEDSRRDGLGVRDKGPRSEWQKTLEDRMKGEASTRDVLAAFQKQYQTPLSQSPQATAERKGKEEGRRQALRDKIAGGGVAPETGAAAPGRADGTKKPPAGGATTAPGGQKEEEFKPTLDAVGIRQSFKDFYSGALKRTGANIKDHVKRVADTNSFSTDLEDIINDIKEKGFEVNPDEFKKAVGSSFGVNLDNYPGWDSNIKSQQSPDSPGAGQQEVAAPTAAPEAKTPQPGQQEAETPDAAAPAEAAPEEKSPTPVPAEQLRKNSKPGQFKGQVSSDINTEELTVNDTMNLLSYRSAMRDLRSGRGMTGRNIEGYDWGVSRGLPPTPEKEDKLLESRKQQEATPQESKKPAPATAAPSSRGGGRGGRSKPAGFFDYKPGVKNVLSQAVSEGKSPQEVVEQFKQNNLFGKTGFETDGSDNRLEDPALDPYRGQPIEPRPGAQAGGRELPTAARRQEGQGSLFKRGTEFDKNPQARGDFKKGGKPPKSSQPGPSASRYNYQPDLFGGGGGVKSDLPQTQEPETGAQAGGREPATASRPGGAGQQTFLSRAKGKETEILPSSIQVPKPGQGVTDAKSYTQQLRKAGIPTDKIDKAVKEAFTPPERRGARRSKTVNSSEYQEFAQSVRSLLR